MCTYRGSLPQDGDSIHLTRCCTAWSVFTPLVLLESLPLCSKEAPWVSKCTDSIPIPVSLFTGVSQGPGPTDRVLQAMNTGRQQLWRTGALTAAGGGGGGIYASDEMARVSGARLFVAMYHWLGHWCERGFIYILRCCGSVGYLIRSNKEGRPLITVR